MGQQQILNKNVYFLAGAAFWLVFADFSDAFVVFAGFAADVALFAFTAFLGFAALAAKICFLRLSRSNLVLTAGVLFGSFTWEHRIFSIKSVNIQIYSISKN